LPNILLPTVNITNLPTPVVTSIGGIYTSYQCPAFGTPGISESLTIGQTTYVGPTAPTTIYILTESASSTTTLQISGGVLVGPGFTHTATIEGVPFFDLLE
jgi:hypothetical protein